MALFRRFFYKSPPDHLLEISERVYVFKSCLSSDVMLENEYKVYYGGIVAQLQDHFPEASFMVLNFREGEQGSQISNFLSQYDITVMDYPRQYESCPVLPLEMIHHFLRSCESWLSLEGQQNVVLLHCERGAWPVLAFMLSGLLLYRRQYQGEEKTLEMVYKQAPKEVFRRLSPLNPWASQIRYLQYISRRNLAPDWPPLDTPLLMDCLILRGLPCYEGSKGCRPVLRVYGQDPKARATRSSVLLFSTPKTKKHTHLYKQEECSLVKLDIQCGVQGDVVLECMHLYDDLVREEMVFRIMFHTAFVRANVLTVQSNEMDILWDANDHFPNDFNAEVHFTGGESMRHSITTISEDENEFYVTSPEKFFEVEEIFRDVIEWPYHTRESDGFVVVDTAAPSDSEGKGVWKGDVEPNASMYASAHVACAPSPPPPPPPPCFSSSNTIKANIVPRILVGTISKKRQLIGHRRANDTEIMLTKVNIPLPDMMAAILAMDESILDITQIENLIKFFPTKEEMEFLKNYTGDKATLQNCEQYFLELMKVPRAEAKLRVFSYKIQFGTQITELKRSLNTVNSACMELHTSQKLKDIMKKILYMNNTLDQASPVGFSLARLINLSYIRAANSKMTMRHLCKVLASEASDLLDFHKDLASLESASKIQLKPLASEMQAIIKGLEKLNQELTASESDGPVSEVFRKILRDFITIAETEVIAVTSVYREAGRNVDALELYFGEDPNRCPFEQVIVILVDFIRWFKKAHDENVKQAKLEKKKAAKEAILLRKSES